MPLRALIASFALRLSASFALRLSASFALLLSACAAPPNRWFTPDPALLSAIVAAQEKTIHGPATVRVASKMLLYLQADLAFIPPAHGERLLRAIGQARQAKLLGIVISDRSPGAVIAVIYAADSGESGFPELEVVGWKETPELAGFLRQ